MKTFIALVSLAACALGGTPPSWSSRGIGDGGGLYTGTFNPLMTDPAALDMWVPGDMSPLFHTTNSGVSWTTTHFRQLQVHNLPTVQIGTDPSTHAQALYAIFRGVNATEQPIAYPVFSNDNGTTWSACANYPATTAAQIFADPDRTDRILVLVSTGGTPVLRLSNNPRSPGASWTIATFTGGTMGNGARIAGVFFDGDTIFLAANTGLWVSSDGGANFAKVFAPPSSEPLISFAGGKDATNGRRLFAVTVPTSTTVNINSRIQLLYTATNHVWQLDYDAPSPAWTQQSGFASYDYPGLVAMARNDASTAYVASYRTNHYPDNCTVYKLAGGVWSAVLATANNTAIRTGWGGINDNPIVSGQPQKQLETALTWDRPRGLAVHPLDASKLLLSDSALTHLSTDGGANWQQVYTDQTWNAHTPGVAFPHGQSYRGVGFEEMLIYWLDFAGSVIAAGCNDIKTFISSDGGKTWGFPFDHTGLPAGDCYQDLLYRKPGSPLDGVRFCTSSYTLSPYASDGVADDDLDDIPTAANQGAPGVFYLTSGATTWQTLKSSFDDRAGQTPKGPNAVFLALDPTRARLYVSIVGSDTVGVAPDAHRVGIWRADLSAWPSVTWTHLPLPPQRTVGRDLVHPYNIRVLANGDLATSWSARQIGANTNPFINDSGVFIFREATQSWDADTNHSGMTYWTHDVVLDPHHTQTFYACTWSTGAGASYDNRGGVYRSLDGGATWVPIWQGDAANGVSGSCTSLTVNPDPQFANEAYLCTRYGGLYFTSNLDAATPTFTQVANYGYRQPNRVFFNPSNTAEIWIASNGNGLHAGTRPTTFAEWQVKKFGANASDPQIAGASADPDGDGVSNLVEYQSNTEPLSVQAGSVVTTGTVANCLAITFTRITNASDAALTVQVSNDLVTWLDGSTYGPAGDTPSNANTTEVSRATSGVVETITVRDNVPQSLTAHRFIRLKIVGS